MRIMTSAARSAVTKSITGSQAGQRLLIQDIKILMKTEPVYNGDSVLNVI